MSDQQPRTAPRDQREQHLIHAEVHRQGLDRGSDGKQRPLYADLWPSAFNELLMFRRGLRTTFSLPMRAEVKANYLLRNSGDLRPLALGPGARRIIYRAHLGALDTLPARAFAIAVDKRQLHLPPAGYFDRAWEGLIQRLERTNTKVKATFAVFHDEGEEMADLVCIRGLSSSCRSAGGYRCSLPARYVG